MQADLSIAQALAGYAPMIGPLPEKQFLVETLQTLMTNASMYRRRLPELRISLMMADRPDPRARNTAETLAKQDSWGAALSWISRRFLPAYCSLVGEIQATAFDVTLARDLELFALVHANLSRLAAAGRNLEFANTSLDDLEPPQAAPFAVCNSECELTALTRRVCHRRKYPDGAQFTTHPVRIDMRMVQSNTLAAFLHDNLQIEFISTDIPALNMAEFPRMPFQFYADMARHVHDEMRHSRMLLDLMRTLGADIGSFPFETPDRYEILAGQDLTFRLIILSRTGEAEAIEGMGRMMPAIEQDFGAVARALDFALADEIQHVAYANHWIRYILGGDDDRIAHATAEALSRYNDLARQIGLPKSSRPTDYLNCPRGFEIDRGSRELAGFTKAEIELMVRATVQK